MYDKKEFAITVRTRNVTYAHFLNLNKPIIDAINKEGIDTTRNKSKMGDK